MNSRYVLRLFILATTALVAGACGGNSGNKGAPGANGNLVCPSSSLCDQAEVEAYGSCIITACQAPYEACFGPDFKTGNYSNSNPCGPYYNCVGKCGCTDNACRAACGLAPFNCQACILNQVTPCVSSSGCKQPTCVTGGLPDGSTDGRPDGSTVTGLPDGGGIGTSVRTCADLARCCASLTDAQQKQSCNLLYTSTRQTATGAIADMVCSSFGAAFCP